MKQLFDQFSQTSSKAITNIYSTSFSMGIRLFDKDIQYKIYSVYGFVRIFDEIVDSFHDYKQSKLFYDLKNQYYQSLEDEISTNPILNSFQFIVRDYALNDLVENFLDSMEADLNKKEYKTKEEYNQYIYGSADVVGLMCLKIFVNGDNEKYESLKNSALKLGSAFQKVNFLRDIQYDKDVLGRTYFYQLENTKEVTQEQKNEIINEIKDDFSIALGGIKKLPSSSRFGVYLAYKYYLALLKKIESNSHNDFLNLRVRINDLSKILILKKSYIRYQLNVL